MGLCSFSVNTLDFLHLPLHNYYSFSFRLEDKQCLHYIATVYTIFLFLPLPPQSCPEGGKNILLHCITWINVQQKRLTNKRSIKYHSICFYLHISKHATFDQAGKNCTDNINALFPWQWHELFNQWYCQQVRKINKQCIKIQSTFCVYCSESEAAVLLNPPSLCIFVSHLDNCPDDLFIF